MGNETNREFDDVTYEEKQTHEEVSQKTSEGEGSEEELKQEEQHQEEVDSAEESQDSEVKQLELKLEEATNRMLRIQADYDNFRRRTKQEKESAAKYKSQSLAEKLLPALDNFERGMAITPQEEETKSLLKGMDMVYRQIKNALEEEGISEIDAVGQPFDPHYHQAVMQVETDDYGSNIVVEEMQKGYQLKDRVIRPAMVKVNA
ncbi:nucleotide exchange factor GrpE [Salipaludibacillus aurantiacus]|uniref:Protein GrpE n=1 Tax=Salipaludibacillus aurantiacus TaxID=1601833 RepID=A0A1H9RDQ9_9BACI|nr:nucleotide exchange factor GrpE [Salipaludibacillus aurantiacus]SER70876.1 molecular chaperone GrpE [Salipaludibacillus aurantiacus]